MNRARLVVADDHHVVRQGLHDLVARTTDLVIVGEAADGLEAERLARQPLVDLLIMDIALPGRRGFPVLQSLRDAGVQVPVLFFSMFPASQYADFARRAGAQGYVGKDVGSHQVLDAIRRILKGQTSFQADVEAALDFDREENLFKRLSHRETEVLHGLLRGQPLVELAAMLGLSSTSITTYRRRLLAKLGVTSNAELVALANRHHMY